MDLLYDNCNFEANYKGPLGQTPEVLAELILLAKSAASR